MNERTTDWRSPDAGSKVSADEWLVAIRSDLAHLLTEIHSLEAALAQDDLPEALRCCNNVSGRSNMLGLIARTAQRAGIVF
jgi:hypothetical protein